MDKLIITIRDFNTGIKREIDVEDDMTIGFLREKIMKNLAEVLVEKLCPTPERFEPFDKIN